MKYVLVFSLVIIFTLICIVPLWKNSKAHFETGAFTGTPYTNSPYANNGAAAADENILLMQQMEQPVSNGTDRLTAEENIRFVQEGGMRAMGLAENAVGFDNQYGIGNRDALSFNDPYMNGTLNDPCMNGNLNDPCMNGTFNDPYMNGTFNTFGGCGMF